MSGKHTVTEAFDIGTNSELVAFVGAGGKTTLMMALAKRLPGRTIVTTTTRLFEAQIESAVSALPAVICRYPDLTPLDENKLEPGIFLVVGPEESDKVTGVPLTLPGQLLARPDVDHVLVEADGAKLFPVKAPADHEPALPESVTLVVPVIGVDALGGRIVDVAHRSELVAHLLGKAVTDRLVVEDLTLLLNQTDSGLKNVATHVRLIAVINKVETPNQLEDARLIAGQVLGQQRVQRVVLSSAISARPVVEVHRRVTAVVLAAGQSQRMGRSKQLLPWGDTTVLGQTLRNLKETAVYDILVVTGSEAEKVKAIAQEEGVPTQHNSRHATGEMLSSLQTAIENLPNNRTAVLVMMADQPMVTAPVINHILQAYWRGEGDIVAPEFGGRRGNPVLIDRRHFEDLLALPLGSAPRDLLKRHQVYLVPTTSETILQDIDLLEDYEKYRPDATHFS